ncbi:MAG: response regulator [Magnetococcales bacterium]|nr:response regulator [Magnetococcales bacterium]
MIRPQEQAVESTHRLQRVLLFIAMGGIFLTGLAVVAGGLLPLYGQFKQEQHRDLLLALKDRTRLLEQGLRNAIDVALQVASRTMAREKLAALNRGEVDTTAARAFIEPILDDALQQSQSVTGILRLDRHDRLVAQVGRMAAAPLWPIPGPDAAEPRIRGPVPIDRQLHILVGTPILDRHGERQGTDIVLCNFATLLNEILDPVGSDGPGRFRLAWSGDGGSGLFPPAGEPPLEQLSTLMSLGPTRSAGVTELDAGWVVAFGPVVGMPWTLLASQPASRLYSGIARRIAWNLLLLLALMVAGAAATLWWLRLVSRRVLANEQALIDAKERAEAADRAKSQFLAVMSHELRTPLNVLLGLGDILLESSLTREQRGQLEMVHQAGGHLLTVIGDILKLSQIEAGAITLDLRPFQPETLLTSLARIMEQSAQAKGLALVTTLDPGLPTWLLGDEGHIRQVVMTLLGNAIKFTEQGRIVLEATHDPRDNHCTIRVADTGIGIAPEHLERIFDRFTQVDASVSRRYGGTGLGLAIARRLVDGMGGRITVDSMLGVGSTFRVCLPLPPATPPAPTGTNCPTDPAPPDAGPARHILLVEDSEDNRLLIRTFLKSTPHQLTIAAHGGEAVQLVQTAAFDLVLMDVQMPVMDGYTATREIRRWEAATGRSRLPIVTLTAHALEGEADRSRAAGCDLHLTKPIKKERLLAVIRQMAA